MQLEIISSTDADEISRIFCDLGISTGHYTNGIYADEQKVFVPTNLACFQLLVEESELVHPTDAFIVAVNSNESVEKANDKLRTLGKPVPQFKDQFVRAVNIAQPIAQQFLNRKVVAVFYDEDAPAAVHNEDIQQDDGLYNRLTERGQELVTLSKGGFGTDPRKGPIIGTDLFQKVIAYPYPADTADISNYCADISGKPVPLPKNVEIVRLTEREGLHGQPYVTEGNKVLFPVNHRDLRQFAA